MNDIDSNFEFNFRNGLSFVRLKKWEKALESFEKALTFCPNSSETFYNLALVCENLELHELALTNYEKALIICPNFVHAHINRGVLLHNKFQFDDAIEAYDEAIKLNPLISDAWLNRGNSLYSQGNYVDALASYQEALQINPNSHDVLWHKSIIELTKKNFSLGWELYESRFYSNNGISLQFTKIRRLTDTNKLSNKKILVWHEQGYGDSIQFCRYINLLSEKGAEVIFYVPEALLKLFRESFCFKCTDRLDEIGRVDFQIPLLSIPRLFNINPYIFAPNAPYLQVSQSSIMDWEKKLMLKVRRGRRIGLAITGNPLHTRNKLRSINPERLLTVDANFFLIQKGSDPILYEIDINNKKIIDCGEKIRDFYDSASIVKLMDFVISVDTSLAHLSGALGVKTLLLLPYVSDWRWFEDTKFTPWYKNTVIFRQHKPNEWEGVIEKALNYLNS